MNSNQSGYIKENAHYFPLRVYFSDTDAGGIVYHSKYLDMAEHARTEMLILLGIDHSGHMKSEGTCFVVKSVNVDYIAPAFLEEKLVIRSNGGKLGRFSFEMKQDVLRGEQPLVSLSFKLGFISLSTGRPSPIPGEWVSLLGKCHRPE